MFHLDGGMEKDVRKGGRMPWRVEDSGFRMDISFFGAMIDIQAGAKLSHGTLVETHQDSLSPRLASVFPVRKVMNGATAELVPGPGWRAAN